MGQFDSMGLPPVGQIGLSDRDRGRGNSIERDEPMTRVTKKDKPKTAAAGGGANPPKTPPKGPTGPKGPDKDKYNKKVASNSKKLGYLDKGKKK